MSSRTASRIHVDTAIESNAELVLGDEPSHYVARVLRLKPGDALTVFDGRGGEYAASITTLSKGSVTVSVGAHLARDRESPLSIHLVQGIGRGDRMDFVVQKATELGACRITPVVTRFSVVRLDESRRDKRVRHWTRVAQSACEQCGRNIVPPIEAPRSLEKWLDGLQEDGRLRIVLQPSAASTLTALESRPAGIDLLIGPEGGLSEQELAAAVSAGFVPCTFGPRTLRTETAALAAIAVLQARWGDLR